MRNAVGVGVREVESRLEVSLGEEGTPPALKLAPLRRRVLFQCCLVGCGVNSVSTAGVF